MCMRACVYVRACPPVCAYVREYDCLLPGVHVSMIIRNNIMQDEYLYHNYVLQCSLFARPEDHWQESDTNGRIERLK